MSSLYLHSRWPGQDIRKLRGVYLQAKQCDSHKWQRKIDKWQTWASPTRRSPLHVRKIWLPDYVCELFLNRDLSHTVINHRATHKLSHLQPREPISGLLTLSSDDECRAPSDIFSFSDEIDQSSNPEEKSLKAGLAGRSSSSRLRPAIHHSHNKKRKSREKPLSFLPFLFFLLDVDGLTEITKASLSSRVSEIRVIWPQDWIYRHAMEQWPGLHGNIKPSQCCAGLCDPSPVPCRHQWTAPNLSVTIDKKIMQIRSALESQLKWSGCLSSSPNLTR